jgi:hypothetical protein
MLQDLTKIKIIILFLFLLLLFIEDKILPLA